MGEVRLEARYRATETSTKCMICDGPVHVLGIFRRHTEIVWRVQALTEGAPSNPAYARLKASSWLNVRAAIADVEAALPPSLKETDQ